MNREYIVIRRAKSLIRWVKPRKRQFLSFFAVFIVCHVVLLSPWVQPMDLSSEGAVYSCKVGIRGKHFLEVELNGDLYTSNLNIPNCTDLLSTLRKKSVTLIVKKYENANSVTRIESGEKVVFSSAGFYMFAATCWSIFIWGVGYGLYRKYKST